MHYLKIPGLLAAVAIASALLATTAPATTLTSPEGTVYTGAVKAESEGDVVLDNPIAKIECSSSMEGPVESHGEGVTPIYLSLFLQFSNCKNGWHVTVIHVGIVRVHWIESKVGTVTSNGTTIEATRFGISCRYATNETDLGTHTGGFFGRMHYNAAIPFHSGSFLCGSGATSATGTYKITTPASLYIDS